MFIKRKLLKAEKVRYDGFFTEDHFNKDYYELTIEKSLFGILFKKTYSVKDFYPRSVKFTIGKVI